MFEKPIRNALYGLTEIRNLFAHRLNMTFADKGDKLKQAVLKLTLHEGRTHYPTPFDDLDSAIPLDPTETIRDKLLVNLKIGLIWLMKDHYAHLPWSNIPVAPNAPPTA